MSNEIETFELSAMTGLLSRFDASNGNGHGDVAELVTVATAMAGMLRKVEFAAGYIERSDVTLWGDVGGRFSCTEVESLADLLEAVGLPAEASYLMTGHFYAEGSEKAQEVEEHVTDGVRDVRIDPSVMFTAGTEPY